MHLFRNIFLKLVLLVIIVVSVAKIASITIDKKDEMTQESPAPKREWLIKSIDTMKYSRDLASEKLSDPSFESIIDRQTKAIKDTGASHIVIATPYDSEFVPYMARWVSAARKNQLKVWFRGNFSGWEGWFGHPKTLTREEHTSLMRNFISRNASLFEDGDAFSPCPECENGGPGDPRQTGDVFGFRDFMISENIAAEEEFKKINKKVRTNLASMNLDVAKIIMDKETTKSMGGLVVIDHYVDTPQKLNSDIDHIAAQSGGKVFLGEYGVPIPDIHGRLDSKEQASWIETSLGLLINNKNLIGLNYWTSVGGSTEIFDENGKTKEAAKTLEKYFKLESLPI